jgi:hypothetical protein
MLIQARGKSVSVKLLSIRRRMVGQLLADCNYATISWMARLKDALAGAQICSYSILNTRIGSSRDARNLTSKWTQANLFRKAIGGREVAVTVHEDAADHEH